MNGFTEKLRIPAGRPFRLLLLHTIGAGAENASACAGILENLIRKSEPDLVLLNGDITAEQTDPEALENCLGTLLSPILTRQIPWAHTFGDKDRIDALDGDEQLAVYRKIPGCLTVSGPENISGCGNYIIPLYRENTDEPCFFLWCMDSHDHVEKYQWEYGSPTRARLASPLYTQYYNDGIRFNQTMWYYHTSRALEETYGRKIPGILCFHIPTPEHSLIPMNQSQTAMEGTAAEEVSCQTVNGGIFSAVLERRDVQAILCGNSRHNDFSGRYGGIRLLQTGSVQYAQKALLLEICPAAEEICTWRTIIETE